MILGSKGILPNRFWRKLDKMKYQIENETIKITADTYGGELQSLVNKDMNREYLWHGDAAYWGRRSPVLFPIVGSLKDKEFRYEGKNYPMSQHGFARDMEFEMIREEPEEIWFELRANEETLKKYPFTFALQIGYVLDGNSVKVIWRVKNNDKKAMYFSIGGHPAFLCPIREGTSQTEYYLRFGTEEGELKENVTYGKINSQGLLSSKGHELKLENGMTSIDEHMFDEDALIFEKPAFTCVELLTPEQVPYLCVTSELPLTGIWSPAKKAAPFVCIEPWCGRCDAVDFDGELKDREYGNVLEPGEEFEARYEIRVR